MQIESVIADIKTSLLAAFAAIDQWFDKDTDLRRYKPADGGWSIDEILEHIGLTNHFLLILIDKGRSKALQNIHQLDLAAELRNQAFHYDQLAQVGLHKSFDWIRPEHMEPKGEKTLPEVRKQLKDQAAACLATLDKLKNGEGVLYKTTMSVNNLGKINIYEYVYFLAQHGHRHITQMEKVEQEYLLSKYGQ
jgi:hypothetical protein